MDHHQIILTTGAIMSGMCFGLIGIAYRWGQSSRVSPLRLVIISGFIGAIFFGLLMHITQWRQVPVAIWVWGIMAGITQYIALRLLKAALALGPLSPTWCAVNLNFVPPVIYACLFLNEYPSGWQEIGIVFGISGIVIGAWGQQNGAALNRPSKTLRSFLRYCAILSAIFISNSIFAVGIKQLSVLPAPGAENYMALHGHWYFFLLYFSMTALACLTVLREKSSGFFERKTILPGMLVAAGSIGGMWLLGRCAGLPAVVLFPLNNAASIVLAGLTSLLVFKERISWHWFLMISGVVAAAILVNLRHY